MGPSTVATILAVIRFLREWGPVLRGVGVEVKNLYDFVRDNRNNPELTDEQRAEIVAILEVDPTEIRL